MQNKHHLYSVATDDVLWSGIQSGEALALSGLMKRYYRSLVHYGTKFTTDITLLEDCIQDLFTELWRRQTTLPTPPSAKNYLFKAYRNHLLDALSRNNRYYPEHFLSDSPSDELTMEDLLIQDETSLATERQLDQALNALSVRQREAIYLKYYENLSYEQIADVMAINRQSVANLLQQAIHKLRIVWQFLVLLAWIQ